MTILLRSTKDDAELQADVLAEIARDPRFRPAEIGVEVDSGVVTLTGTVSSYPKLTAAANIAAEIAGVKGVANELTLEMSSAFIRTDTELVAAIREALRWDIEVPDEKVEVIVRNGRVTLMGTVDYWFERVAAVKAVERLSGIVAVHDQIAVKPQPVGDADVAAEIGDAIARRTSGANRLSIDVKAGAVTLRGRALTPHDRYQAEKAAWSTKGVRTVLNQIEVTW